MAQDEGNRRTRASASRTADDDQNASRLQPRGLEPELTALTSESLLVDGTSAAFVAQIWHRPYAEALIEADPVRLRALIAEAEQAIRARYLQLCVSSVPWDEDLDLLDAMNALAELKKAIRGIAGDARTNRRN
jgi:hypothetical protein